jgi:hypothetical protein
MEIHGILNFILLPSFQIISPLTFSTLNLTARVIKKNLCKYSQIQGKLDELSLPEQVIEKIIFRNFF